jgi:cell division inhibitor SepF
MPGVWKKTLSYLGLVEEDYQDVDDAFVGDEFESGPAPVRRLSRPAAAGGARTGTALLQPVETTEGLVRTMPATPRSVSGGHIHAAEPKRFDEAREVGDRFKDGVSVIMNLQGTEDAIARRLVDFASGLVFGLDGKIEMVANRVYLLTPPGIEVSAEERQRIRDAGLYNQF